MFRTGIKSSGKWYCLLCQVVQYDTVSHQRRLELSTTLLCKPQILHTRYVAAPDRNIQQINVESGSTLLTLCSNNCASLISKYRWGQLDATNSDLLVIGSISTCFGHLYAHRQETRLRSTARSCMPCCSCCDAGESGSKMCALCGECCLTKSGNILHTVHTSCYPTLQHHNSYNRADNYGQWNAVGSPGDGDKDARNMLRCCRLPITHYLLHLVGLTFTYYSTVYKEWIN